MVFFGHFVPSRSVNTYIHTYDALGTKIPHGLTSRWLLTGALSSEEYLGYKSLTSVKWPLTQKGRGSKPPSRFQDNEA